MDCMALYKWIQWLYFHGLGGSATMEYSMIEEKGYNMITMMIVVNNERFSKLEKGNQLDKPLIKVQYK